MLRVLLPQCIQSFSCGRLESVKTPQTSRVKIKFFETVNILQDCIENAHGFRLIYLRVFAGLEDRTKEEIWFLQGIFLRKPGSGCAHH